MDKSQSHNNVPVPDRKMNYTQKKFREKHCLMYGALHHTEICKMNSDFFSVYTAGYFTGVIYKISPKALYRVFFY